MDTDSTARAIRVVRAARAGATAIATATLVCLLLMLTAAPARALTPAQALAATQAYIITTVKAPEVGSVGGEWAVIGLARADAALPAGYWQGYLGRVSEYVAARGDKLHGAKSTDNERVILALTALGRDPTVIAGHDLVAPLADMDWVTNQGINGAVFALIAANSGAYTIPTDVAVANQATEAKLIAFILGREVNKDTAEAGGWTLIGSEADPDITAMVLQASAPYYEKAGYADLTQAVDRALTKLSAMQLADGGFQPASFMGGEPTSESSAQVVIALTALGVDPTTDARFVKAGGNPMTALLSYAQNNGSFLHTKSGGGVNQMATEQAYLALVAHKRFKAGARALYDMKDSVTKLRTPLTKVYLVKGTRNWKPVVLGDAGIAPTLTFGSSKATVASVSATGKINALKVGTSTITARALNGKTLRTSVIVAARRTALRSFTFTGLAASLKVGGTAQLKLEPRPAKATNLKATFRSSNVKVVTVDAAGKVRALKKGSVSITVTLADKKRVKKLTVK